MKNQNDLIISIVAIVLALIIMGVCIGTKREPIAPAAPEKVNLVAPALPQGDVVMANALGSTSSSGGTGGPSASGGGAINKGGRPGVSTPSAGAGGKSNMVE
ncbi:MAG TPA: hypothetical protein VJ835_02220 [Fimbriimonadaceae bacterium]|nr:hypothetical protein [Fimbriimonadaceae bacterium]